MRGRSAADVCYIVQNGRLQELEAYRTSVQIVFFLLTCKTVFLTFTVYFLNCVFS